jgi:hypothetical protein
MKHPVGPCDVDGEAISTVKTMANMVDQFPSVFSTPLSLEATAHSSNNESVELTKLVNLSNIIVTDQDKTVAFLEVNEVLPPC